MKKSGDHKKKKYFVLAMTVVLAMQVVLLLYYGNKKSGFHEDELYTYYSSNRTAGLFVEDRTWLEKEQLHNEFVVLPGEQFRYGLVKQVQSWDVHPPFYYYLFHTACSLVPGIFSKWPGLLVNLAGYVLSYVLLALVADTAAQQKAYGLTLLVCGFWGFSSAVISGVMFIRMYQWLTVFVLLCLWLHLRAMKKEDYRIRSFLLHLGFTVFLGFLTQYYYIIFHFFLGAGFCFLLLRKKKLKELLAYGITCMAGLGAAILYYPSGPAHIFRGYRGTEAVSEFSNVSNTWERLRFFYGLLDDYVMNHTLSFWLLLLCLVGVTAGYLDRRKEHKGLSEPIGLMVFAVLGYFFTISKTALLLGETSNRYQLPVYGILIFLLLYGLFTLTGRILSERTPEKKYGRALVAAFALALILVDGLALKAGRVFFVYEEEIEMTEFIRQNQEIPAVVFYNEASEDHIWWLADKLMEQEGVYLAAQGNPQPISDERIVNSDKLLVYMADHERETSFLEGLMAENPRLSKYRAVAKKGLWTLYEMS